MEQEQLTNQISKSYQNSESIFQQLQLLLDEKKLSDDDYIVLRMFKHLCYRWREFDYTLLSILMHSSNEVLKKIYELEKVLEFLFLDSDNKVIEEKINSLFEMVKKSKLVNKEKRTNKQYDKDHYYGIVEAMMLNSFNHKTYDLSWTRIKDKKVETLKDLIIYVNQKTYSDNLDDKVNKILKKQFYVGDNGNLTYTNKELLVVKELLIAYNSILKDFIFYLLEKYQIPNSIVVSQISDLMFEITEMHYDSI